MTQSGKVRIAWITPEAEGVIAYCARVSSKHQDNPDYAKLLRYCVKHGHWSVFEMASMCVEIDTSRAIAAQIIRHRTFSFQEFSQRYSEAPSQLILHTARRQDQKNRQASHDDMLPAEVEWFNAAQRHVHTTANQLYVRALDRGIAKECARMLLPLGTKTRIYMAGTIRSWLHYVEVRSRAETQAEHREIAEAVKALLYSNVPTVATAMFGPIGGANE